MEATEPGDPGLNLQDPSASSMVQRSHKPVDPRRRSWLPGRSVGQQGREGLVRRLGGGPFATEVVWSHHMAYGPLLLFSHEPVTDHWTTPGLSHGFFIHLVAN
jgi:hypothetical protein